MTINFYLDKNKNLKSNERTIYVYVGFGKKRLVFNTGEKIDPKYWDVLKQQSKKSYVGSPELNSFLNYIKEEIKKLNRQLTIDKIFLSDEEFKLNVHQIIKKTQPQNTNYQFFDAFNRFIETKKNIRSHRSIQKYYTLLNHLKNFQTTKKFTLSFDKMNMEFYERFTDYLFNNKKMTDNTVGKYISTLKTFLSWAYDLELTKISTFRRYKVFEKKAEIIYLTSEELSLLENLELENKSLEQVRDVFCFACYTGQRFSDISSIQWEDLSDNYWNLRSYKTKDIIRIPLIDKATKIIQKYRECEKPLPIISHQKTNEYIKEMCKIAGLTELVTINRYSASRKIEITKPKYEFVTTHTARRTFVTLSLEKGLRPEMVMEITGHKEYKTMKKYMRITDKRKEIELKQAWERENLIKRVI
ncbi:MAG: site-specific integrase [Melioribacteraceae bacterium]|nr:site-specific integrase [Melioribacteraceae bacterium]